MESTALGGIRVLECGEGVSAPFCTRVLADLGAEVIKAESHGGDPSRQWGPFPDGLADAEHSAMFAYLNAGKKSLRLSGDGKQDGETLHRFVEGCDVLVTNLSLEEQAKRRIDLSSLAEGRPTLVTLHLSPYGLSGPDAGVPAEEVNISAIGGISVILGEPPRPPLSFPFGVPALQAGLHGAAAVLTALLARRLSGLGQAIDVAEADVLSFYSGGMSLFILGGGGQWKRRGFERHGGIYPSGFYPCQDGFIFLATQTRKQWNGFLRLMGNPEWAQQDPALQDGVAIGWKRADEVDVHFIPWLMQFTRRQLTEMAREADLVLGPINEASELLDEPHLVERRFWHRVDLGGSELRLPGMGYTMATTPVRLGAAPRLGEHDDLLAGGPAPACSPLNNSSVERERAISRRIQERHRKQSVGFVEDFATPSPAGKGRSQVAGVFQRAARANETVGSLECGPSRRRRGATAPEDERNRSIPINDDIVRAEERPLAGYRAIEFGWNWAGPLVGQILADLGMQVIKVETRERQDFMRHWPHARRFFHNANRGKQSVSINIKTEEGAQLVRRLAGTADLLFDNFAAGVMARNGLGYERLVEAKADLIVLSMAMGGQTGSLRHLRGFATTATGFAGLEAAIGYADAGSTGLPSIGLGDANAAIQGVVACLAALWHREQSGQGQFIDLSQIEAATALAGEPLAAAQLGGGVSGPHGNDHPRMAPHGIYPVAGDDRWISLAVTDDAAWSALVGAMGEPDWARDESLATTTARCGRRAEIDSRLSEWTAGIERDALVDQLRREGLAVAPVLEIEEMNEWPQFVARGLRQEVPSFEGKPWMVYNTPWHLSRTPRAVDLPSPAVGEHNDAIFHEILGMSAAETAALAERKVIW